MTNKSRTCLAEITLEKCPRSHLSLTAVQRPINPKGVTARRQHELTRRKAYNFKRNCVAVFHLAALQLKANRRQQAVYSALPAFTRGTAWCPMAIDIIINFFTLSPRLDVITKAVDD